MSDDDVINEMEKMKNLPKNYQIKNFKERNMSSVKIQEYTN